MKTKFNRWNTHFFILEKILYLHHTFNICKVMTTVTLEYDAQNSIVNGLLDVIAKIPGVKIAEKEDAGKKKSQTLLLERAKKIDRSINKNTPKMTMEEIVQEIRDYRNGK